MDSNSNDNNDKNNNELEWFLPDKEGSGTEGPFSTDQIKEMIKNNKIQYDNYISCPQYKNETWLRLYECPQFKDLQKMKPLPAAPKLFSASKNKAPSSITEKVIVDPLHLQEKFILHDNNIYSQGLITEIAQDYLSAQIAGEHSFAKGDEVSITVFNSNKIPSFSLKGVILDKKEEQGLSLIKLYYLKINPEVRRKINQFLASHIAE